MPAPSALAIATSSVQRLVKEESYYHKELASQQVRVDKLEADVKEQKADLDENAEYMLKQEVGGLLPSFPYAHMRVHRSDAHMNPLVTETSHGTDKVRV